MNKAIIFDWSGTLSDEFDIFCEVCNLVFAELGHPLISPEEIKYNFTTPYMKFWNKYFPDLNKEDQNKIYEACSQKVDLPELHIGVKEIIRYLYKLNYKLFVVSSDSEFKIFSEIEDSGLASFFTEIISGSYKKEDQIKSLLKKYNLNNEQTFCVGDTDGDIDAGKLAGIKTIAVSWGIQHEDTLKKSNPDYIIDDLVKIKDIIKK